jgi:hypothetical protein
MIAQASAAIRHTGALLAMRRASVRSSSLRRHSAVAVGAAAGYTRLARARHGQLLASIAVSAATYQAGVRILKMVAAVLAGATVGLAVMNYRDAREAAPVVAAPVVVAPLVAAPAAAPSRNETIVYRHVPMKSEARLSDAEASSSYSPDRFYGVADMPANYPRAVQTVRFVNPTSEPATIALASAASEPVAEPRATLKVGGFVAFPGKETATEPEAATGTSRPYFPGKRSSTVMDEVDDYLWEVYQRAPVKRDGSGDFTWKDPAAAKKMGLPLAEYVILGMDPDFREQLYHAGKAMDAAGLQWSMLSAFRDDYRQRLASGFKARGGNSLHGGSTRTGGYGHGRAIDITNADGDLSAVWHWIDAHGAKYGLTRPMPGNDPAHIQQRGEWHKIAAALRASRGVTLAQAPSSSDKDIARHPTAKHKGRVRFAKAR